jgi:hypothetical protein
LLGKGPRESGGEGPRTDGAGTDRGRSPAGAGEAARDVLPAEALREWSWNQATTDSRTLWPCRRSKGILALDQVWHAYLERNGSISIIKKNA